MNWARTARGSDNRMYILVWHQISDPRAFESIGERAQSKRPSRWRLHHSLPSRDRTLCVCLWEADSVGALREFMDPTYAGVSANAYYEVDEENAMGLLPPPATVIQVIVPRSTKPGDGS